MSDNTVKFIGRLTWDPDVRRAQTGRWWGTFSIAANHHIRTKNGLMREDVAFIRCKAFNSLAEGLATLKKGSMVVVQGHFVDEAWEKDGQKHRQPIVICDSILSVTSCIEFAPAAQEQPLATPQGNDDDKERPPF